MSALRSRSLLSLLRLSVMLHRKFGSRKVIDVIYALGFCASYYEAQLYETSALYQDSVILSNDLFIQFVLDNANFNTPTLIQPRQYLPQLKSIPSENYIAKIHNIWWLKIIKFLFIKKHSFMFKQHI